jgi:quercetin dioxygenase-like cupin family protein
MIIRSENGKHREFKGIHFDVLATGENSMVTRMSFNTNDLVPSHSHPNEQCGYVVSGEYKLTIGNISDSLFAGDSYTIPASVAHALEVINGGIIIDFFTPPRKDYL